MIEHYTSDDNELFGILANSSPAGIYILQDGKFQLVNKQFLKQTGYTEEELLGQGSLDLVLPDDRPRVKKNAVEMLKGERLLPYEYRVVYKGGTIRWNLETVASIRYKGSRAVLGSFMDITEHKQMEELLHRSLDETAHNQRLLLAFSHAAQAVHRAISPDEIYQTVLNEMSRIGYHTAILTLTDDRKHLAISHMTNPLNLPKSAEEVVRAEPRHFRLKPGSLHHRVITEQKTIFVSDFGQAIAESLPEQERASAHYFAESIGIEQVICAPLSIHGEVCGLLSVAGNDLSLADEPVINAFASQISIAIEKALLIQEVQERAITDGLTGLYNHRHFHEALQMEAKRSMRSGKPMSLIMADIDDFKAINDSYGHQTGDGVLKRLSSLLRGTLRATDVLARYGGEEFAIILPETSCKEAIAVAERICRMAEDYQFKADSHTISLSLSAGVASFEAGLAETTDDLIKKADDALYQAKQQGRNRVCIAG